VLLWRDGERQSGWSGGVPQLRVAVQGRHRPLWRLVSGGTVKSADLEGYAPPNPHCEGVGAPEPLIWKRAARRRR
jgi:hypothetical protein